MQVEITVIKGTIQLKMIADNDMEHEVMKELTHQQPVRVCFPDDQEKEPKTIYIIGKEKRED